VQLRDGNLNTYWQSDGPQPHCVNIQFPKTVSICRVDIYADVKVDESYTPSVISLRAGSFLNDLREVKQFTLTDASGWVSLSVVSSRGEPLKAIMIQVLLFSIVSLYSKICS
jgi:anaphase-promoting complex subunit 10